MLAVCSPEHVDALTKVRLLLMDVDGIMTNGKITYGPDGYELKFFNTKDGLGLTMLRESGVLLGIITGRSSECVQKRAKDLKVEIYYEGIRKKIIPYEEILEQYDLTDEEVAYMGDDVIDLPILERAGFAVTVSDAMDEVKGKVHLITKNAGGEGAVREVCDLILFAKGV